MNDENAVRRSERVSNKSNEECCEFLMTLKIHIPDDHPALLDCHTRLGAADSNNKMSEGQREKNCTSTAAGR